MKASEKIKIHIKFCQAQLQEQEFEQYSEQIEAQISTFKMALKYVEHQEKQTRSVFRWLLGYTNFPIRGAGGPYYWRKDLRTKIKKLGIEFK